MHPHTNISMHSHMDASMYLCIQVPIHPCMHTVIISWILYLCIHALSANNKGGGGSVAYLGIHQASPYPPLLPFLSGIECDGPEGSDQPPKTVGSHIRKIRQQP